VLHYQWCQSYHEEISVTETVQNEILTKKVSGLPPQLVRHILLPSFFSSYLLLATGDRTQNKTLNNAATSVSRQTGATSLSTLHEESASLKQEKKPQEGETGDEFFPYPALLIIYCMSHRAQTLRLMKSAPTTKSGRTYTEIHA